jgi:hypothetical protein
MNNKKKYKITKDSEKSLRKLAVVADKAAKKGTPEYHNFIEKHKKSLKKLANR